MLFAILGMHLVGGNFTPHNPRMPGFGDNSGSLYGRLTGATCTSLGPGGVTIFNSFSLTRPASTVRRHGVHDPARGQAQHHWLQRGRHDPVRDDPAPEL